MGLMTVFNAAKGEKMGEKSILRGQKYSQKPGKKKD